MLVWGNQNKLVKVVGIALAIAIFNVSSAAMAQSYSWGAVNSAISTRVGGLLQPTGASLRIRVNGQIVHTASYGTGSASTPSNQIRVYSVSKWIAATVVMTLIEDDYLSLDDHVTDILDDVIFADQRWSQVKVRHLLSMTSGLPHLLGVTNACAGLPVMTLKACARVIALVPLASDPGSSFRYGGPNWQILAAVAEKASGQDWADLLQNRLTLPCGLTSMDYPSDVNPDVAAGIRSNLFDLSVFAEIQRTGKCGSTVILTSGNLFQMRTSMTSTISSANYINDPYGDGRNYGLGLFLTDRDVNPKPNIYSHAGAGGTYPWVDIGYGYSAILFLDANPAGYFGFGRADEIFNAIVPLIEAQL